MADFFIRVLKWLAALVTAYFLLFVLVFLFIVGLGVFFQPVPKTIEANSVLVLDLGFNLTDQPASDDPAKIIQSALQGDLLESASLREVIEGIRAARKDGRIHSLLITGNLYSDGYGGSFAAIRELRRAIGAFGADKPVTAYLDGDSLRDLYLKSAATEVIVNPYGSVDFRGLRAERMYLGDAFERVGIEVQVEAFEEYKTAAEAFKESRMSPEEREQVGSLIEDIWAVIVGDIAEGRGLDPVALNGLAGSELILFGPEIVAAGLADQQMSNDELIDHLAAQTAYDPDAESFRQFDFLDYLGFTRPAIPELDILGSGNKVAVLYAEGILMEGDGVDGTIGGDDLIRNLRQLRKDDSVKAIVLRINSPGGSATASFKVAREIELTNSVKPVVTSMGGIATSAGYMIAAPAEFIYAEPSTITGSIGVVIMLANVEQLAEKLAINFEGVETHPFAGTYSIGHSKTPGEMAQIRKLSKSFYEDFLSIVAENRDMTMDAVRERAKGRVWSGLAAEKLGLVDATGGLSAAIQRAADLAGIGDDYRLIERPRRLTIEEQIEDLFMSIGAAGRPAVTKGALHQAWSDVEAEVRRLSLLNDPYGQYAILPYSLKIN
jgi:protease-4